MILQPGAQHRRLTQVTHRTGTLHVRQGCYRLTEGNRIGIFAIKGIAGQIQIGSQTLVTIDLSLGAIATDETTDGAN